MFCYKCGTSLPDDACFCVKCGTNVKAAAADVSDRTAPAYQSPAPQAPASAPQRGTVPPAVNKNPAPQECDIYENIHENVHYTAMVSVVDKKQLRIVKATYVVVGIHTKQKLFDLMNLSHVTVNKDGTGLLGRKHEAVFYPKNAVPFKLIGTGNSFMIMVQNCAAYANATLEYI